MIHDHLILLSLILTHAMVTKLETACEQRRLYALLSIFGFLDRQKSRPAATQAAGRGSCQKSIGGAAVEASSAFLGLSATSASVVINSEATEAASCRAVRTTLAGSITPAFTRS